MASAPNHKEDTQLPRLGRALTWVDRPGNATKLFYTLGIICIGLFLADFLVERHGVFEFEHTSGFYAIFGFVAFSLIVLGAKLLRKLIVRPQNYYAPHSVDDEADLAGSDGN